MSEPAVLRFFSSAVFDCVLWLAIADEVWLVGSPEVCKDP